MLDTRNLWGMKREGVHLGFFLKIQKGQHKILISIYWLLFYIYILSVKSGESNPVIQEDHG